MPSPSGAGRGTENPNFWTPSQSPTDCDLVDDSAWLTELDSQGNTIGGPGSNGSGSDTGGTDDGDDPASSGSLSMDDSAWLTELDSQGNTIDGLGSSGSGTGGTYDGDDPASSDSGGLGRGSPPRSVAQQAPAPPSAPGKRKALPATWCSQGSAANDNEVGVKKRLKPQRSLFHEGRPTVAVLSCCEGIGGIQTSLQKMGGLKVLWCQAIETSANCWQVLRARHPDTRKVMSPQKPDWRPEVGDTAESDTIEGDATKHPGYSDLTQVTKDQVQEMWNRACTDNADYFLMSSGTPCQDLSGANPNRRGLERGTRSNIFFDAVRILNWLEGMAKETENGPRLCFFFEQVASAQEAEKQLMEQQLGVRREEVCASKFSTMRRRRMYIFNWVWTAPDGAGPRRDPASDLDPNAEVFHHQTGEMLQAAQGCQQPLFCNSRSTWETIMASNWSSQNNFHCSKCQRYNHIMYQLNGRFAFCTHAETDFSTAQKMLNVVECKNAAYEGTGKPTTWYRGLTLEEMEKLFGFSQGYTKIEGLTPPDRKHLLGNSFAVPVVAQILSPLAFPDRVEWQERGA